MPISNSQYTIAPSLQQCFLNPNTGVPLSGGKVYFYQDNNRIVFKPVYRYTGSPTPAFIELPNPVILNGSGCFDDIIYYLPFDQDGNIQLYYIVIYDNLNALITTIENWPQFSETTSGFAIDSSSNYIENGQFLFHSNSQLIIENETPIAPPFWNFRLSNGFTSINNISFDRFGVPASDIESFPRYAVRIVVSNPNPSETEKFLYFSFPDVNTFAGQEITYQFEGISNTGIDTNVQLVMFKNYGTGGSTTSETILQTFVISDTYSKFNYSFTVSDNSLATIGSNDDDSLEIGLRLPISSASDTSYTNFLIITGNQSNITYPITSKYQATYQSLASSIDIPAYDDSDIGKTLVLSTSDQGGIPHIGLTWSSANNNSNFIIPGNFTSNPFQRGTSFTGITGNAKIAVADRFIVQSSPTLSAILSVSRDTDAPPFSLTNYATSNSLAFTVTTPQTSFGTNDYLLFGTCIEGYDYARLAGNNFTLSFKVKSNITGVFCVSFTNEGGDRSFVSEFTINDSNVWEKKFVSVSVPPLDGTWNYTTERGLRILFSFIPVNSAHQPIQTDTWLSSSVPALASTNQVNLCAAGSNYIKFDLISLQEGLASDSFIEPPINQLINHCLRYHEQSYFFTVQAGQFPASGAYLSYVPNNGGGGSYGSIQFAVPFTTFKRNGTNNLGNEVTYYAYSNGAIGMWDVASSQATVLTSISNNNGTITATLNGPGILTYGSAIMGHWIVDTEYTLL